MDYRKISMLRDYMVSMSNGIDPISSLHFENESILNNSHMQQCFKDISEILESLLHDSKHLGSVDRRTKPNFYISDEEKEKVEISDTPITISAFVYKINEVVDITIYKKLRATQLTEWLLNEGYLEDAFADGLSFRKATEKGTQLGIVAEKRISSYGTPYVVNNYNSTAQRFILENINKMV